MNPSLLDMETSIRTTTSSSLTTKIGRNMNIFTNTFANDDYWMRVAAKLPIITLATIIDTLDCSWLNEGIDENMDTLKKYLTALIFCEPPTNPVCHVHYFNMSRFLTTVHKKHELNQDVLHSKPKTTYLVSQRVDK